MANVENIRAPSVRSFATGLGALLAVEAIARLIHAGLAGMYYHGSFWWGLPNVHTGVHPIGVRWSHLLLGDRLWIALPSDPMGAVFVEQVYPLLALVLVAYLAAGFVVAVGYRKLSA